MSKILIFLAQGFEEIEAVTCIDVLRRAEVEVVTLALDELEVKGAHNIIIKADKSINEVNLKEFDGVLLPGGMPGAANLRDNGKVINIVKEFNDTGKLVSAICAAPIVLEKAGVIMGRNATSYPGFNKEMESCNYKEDRVVVDGNIITAKGPGVALEFAMLVVNYLQGKEMVTKLKEEMITNF